MRPARYMTLATAALVCAGRARDRVAAVAFPVVWDSTFQLRSVADVPRRLATATPDSADRARFDNRCTPNALDSESHTCVDVDTVVTNTCDDFFRLWRAGYGAVARINYEPLRIVGYRCTAIQTIGRARPARRSAVRRFRLVPATVDSLPPVLGLNVSRESEQHADSDAAHGVSWRRSEPDPMTVTISKDPYWAGALRVDTASEQDYIQILGRGDFDGDGWDDLLVLSTAGAKHGSLVAFHLFMLTRRAPGTQLRVVRRLW